MAKYVKSIKQVIYCFPKVALNGMNLCQPFNSVILKLAWVSVDEKFWDKLDIYIYIYNKFHVQIYMNKKTHKIY